MADAGNPRARTALVRWLHRSGAEAHCLARLIDRPAPEPPVIVLTELATNADRNGLTTDFGGAATSALRALGSGRVLDPSAISWLAQHGEFSSYDAQGAPETLTEVSVTFDGQAYHCELTDQRLLPAAEAGSWFRALDLEPVPAAVAGLPGSI